VAPPRAAAQEPAPRNPHLQLHGLACSACHGTSSWRQVSFDHRANAHFALLAQHRTVPCAGCHDLRDFRGAPRECASCHTDPHRGDVGGNCAQCHSEVGWHQVGAQNAHARTRLPDLGVHASLQCTDCHRQTGAQQFTGRVTPCVACHQSTFEATANPSHRTMGFGVQCETCHQFTTWNFALFAQHDATFPIYSSTHAGKWRNCATCHSNGADYGVFTCMSGGCHPQPRTDGAHNGIAGYGYTAAQCYACHPTGRAEGFPQHDAVFPIFSGVHAGRWTACSDCHTDPSNRRVFSCMTGACHAQAATDQSHNGIPNYAYTAAQCLACHPTGQAGTFTQHDAIFPIFSGTHQSRWAACSDCHTDPTNRQVFSCMTGSCHPSAETNGTHQGIPGYAYTAAQCLSCHPSGQAGTFTQHDALFFPIYSGTHQARWTDCVACHNVANDRSVFTCMGGSCHPAAQTNNDHTQVSGYAYVAAQCYACHPQGRGGAPPAPAPGRIVPTPRRPPGVLSLLRARRPADPRELLRRYRLAYEAAGSRPGAD